MIEHKVISVIEELLTDNYLPLKAYENEQMAREWVRKNNKFVNEMPKYRIRRIPLISREWEKGPTGPSQT